MLGNVLVLLGPVVLFLKIVFQLFFSCILSVYVRVCARARMCMCVHMCVCTCACTCVCFGSMASIVPHDFDYHPVAYGRR